VLFKQEEAGYTDVSMESCLSNTRKACTA